MTKKKIPQIRKESRDDKARRELTEKVKQKEIDYGKKTEIAKIKNDYIRNIINARYFTERCNMIATQIIDGKILENIDGCPKPVSFMRAEYAQQKMQAIFSMRMAHFAKIDLITIFKFTKEDIGALEKDYYDGKIIRESYDEGYKVGNKAEFVNSSKN